MVEYDLDDVDRQILHMLQEDARGISTDKIGDAVGVAASTVRNRINKMEEAGIIKGYYPEIDYDVAGFSLHYVFFCYVDPERRESAVERILETSGVIETHQLIDSEINLLVEAIAADAHALDALNTQLVEIGLEIKRAEIYKESTIQPFNHFGIPEGEEESE